MDFQITAEDVKEALDRGEKLTLVDVREPWEYQTARLEGAELIPMGVIMLTASIDQANTFTRFDFQLSRAKASPAGTSNAMAGKMNT